jgi:hypothetical protein
MTNPAKKRKGGTVQAAYSMIQDVIGIATLKTIAALGLTFCAFGGCATGSRKSRDSKLFEVTIDFIATTGKTNHEIKIITPPGVPFVVQTQDEAGNHYQMSGTLRKTGEHSVCLDQLSDSGPMESESCPPLDMELGERLGIRGLSSIISGGRDIMVTKK